MAVLEQTQGMHLQQVLSPQMQQSLQVLQAPLMDLRQLVARELAENPALEEEPSALSQPLDAEEKRGGLEETWEPYYAQQHLSSASDAAEKHQFLIDSLTRPKSLSDSVREQLNFLDLSPAEREVAESVAGNLGANGFLDAKVEEIAFRHSLSPAKVEAVLERLQDGLEPPGLAARDLRECLMVQLRRQGKRSSTDMAIVKKYLPLLARRRIGEIAKALRISIEEAQEAAANIAALDPNPARDFDHEPDLAVVPEVIVEADGDGFSVRINGDCIPALRISDHYKDLLGNAAALPKDAKDYLREKIRNGRFFLNSLEQRNQTILSIAKEIVTRQYEFMKSGPAHLKPMTMGSVAQAVGVHETTVSRAVSGKYMLTPQGLFEMKYFFTTGYVTESGEMISNESVRKAIEELVAGEDSAKPLSDEQIVKLLAAQDIKIARRTVAKYRDQLGILPSHLRKR